MNKINEIGKKYGLFVFEDTAQAYCTKYDKKFWRSNSGNLIQSQQNLKALSSKNIIN